MICPKLSLTSEMKEVQAVVAACAAPWLPLLCAPDLYCSGGRHAYYMLLALNAMTPSLYLFLSLLVVALVPGSPFPVPGQ